MPTEKRPLKVFLCHASQDKPVVRELSQRLFAEGWIDPWLDEKKLLPGQDWRLKIEEAVETSDIVVICLSNNSVSKEGFIQKELRYAKEIALEKPDETIFLIPIRLDDCETPRGLRFYQWGDYFGEQEDETYSALLESLKLRYEQKLSLEEEEHARQEKERREREAAEKIAHEQAERELNEKIAREKATREAAEKAVHEKAERDIAAIAALEKAKREATENAAVKTAQEKTAREKAEREAAEKAARKAILEESKRDFLEKVRQDEAKQQIISHRMVPLSNQSKPLLEWFKNNKRLIPLWFARLVFLSSAAFYFLTGDRGWEVVIFPLFLLILVEVANFINQ